MLGEKNAVANIAVKDMTVAKRFYEQTLGLTQLHSEGEEVITYRSGDTMVQVYRSEYAGTNKATAVTWAVGADVDDIIQALKAKGVAFEHYDLPGTSREGDLHVFGDLKIAWFKDPDGNILNVINQ